MGFEKTNPIGRVWWEMRFEANCARQLARDFAARTRFCEAEAKTWRKTDCANWGFEKTNPKLAGPRAIVGFAKTKPISYGVLSFSWQSVKKRLQPKWLGAYRIREEIHFP